MHIRVLRLVLSGLMGALLVVSKQAMSGLPNIEPVTLLVILFALELPRETPGAVTVFILLPVSYTHLTLPTIRLV